MTDNEFPRAMRIASPVVEAFNDPLTEALRIDDLRSSYCEQLEDRIAEQAAVIKLLQFLLRLRGAEHVNPVNDRDLTWWTRADSVFVFMRFRRDHGA